MPLTDPVVFVATKRCGLDDGPLVVFTPAWNDPSFYDELTSALSTETTIVSLEVRELSSSEESDFHSLEPVAEEATRLIAPLVAGRPTAILGYSTDGIVAHELGRRLGQLSVPVSVVALLDTFYPGRPWLHWQIRWDKYRNLYRDRAVDQILLQILTAARSRRKQVVQRIATVWAKALGTHETTTGPDRIRGSMIPSAVRSSEPLPSGAPIVLYLAADTFRSGCEKPWTALEPQLEAVHVRGRHWGEDSMVSKPWVDEIADDIERRLAQAAEFRS